MVITCGKRINLKTEKTYLVFEESGSVKGRPTLLNMAIYELLSDALSSSFSSNTDGANFWHLIAT